MVARKLFAFALALQFATPAAALDASYGISKGWPLGPGQTSYVAPIVTTVSRALNVNHAWTQAFEASGGNSFGRMIRTRLVSPVAFQCVRAVYAMFWQAGSSTSGLFDQDIAQPLNIQAAIELPGYTQAITGITARTGARGAQLTWNGTEAPANSGLTYAYGGAGTNLNHYVVSDKYCAPSVVPANTQFGIWSSVEAPTSQPLSYSITALSSAGTTATATVASTTGLYVNELWNVSGASVTGYNNQGSAITALTATTVSYTTTASNLAVATTATGSPYILPANMVTSSALPRNEGTTAASSSAGSFVATSAVANAASISNFNASAPGVSAGFAPAFLLIDVPSGTKEVFTIGDSVDFGVSAGGTTNVPTGAVAGQVQGDSLGSTDHGISWLDRGIQYNAGLLYVNGGKGSDGAKFLKTPSVWPYRRAMIALANPTHVVNAMAFNDQGVTPYGTWQASTSYNATGIYGAELTSGGNAYILLSDSCTSGASAPTGTTFGGTEANGTCTFAYAGPTTFNGAQGFGWNVSLNRQIKTLLPSVSVYNTTMMPNATYSTVTTLADQTVTASVCGARNNFDALVMNTAMQASVLNAAGTIDINTYLENDPVGHDCKWVVDGTTPDLATFGAHPNSYGYGLASQSITAGSFP